MGELTNSIHARFGFEESEALVVRLKEGEEAAFGEVFHLYKDLVFTLSINMLADKSEALDVTQEVFLTLFRKIHQFRGQSSLKTWLYRVAINKVANRNRWWRRRFRHRTLSLNLEGDSPAGVHQDLVSRNPGPERRVLSGEIREALQAGLERLPLEQRAAITLRDVHALTYEEISQVLGVPIGTVKSRIARGRENLREILQPYREEAAG